MPSAEGAQLAQLVHKKMEEFAGLCAGLDEKTASSAPPGRWSPKEIISHLCGPEGVGILPGIRAILEQDIPRLDMKAEDPFFTGKRPQMTLAELLREFTTEYGRIADLVAGLSDAQLSRKAHIPLLKETPMGEYPTLAVFVGALAEHHIGFHVDHMREILKALNVA
jgi:hypothetical protein